MKDMKEKARIVRGPSTAPGQARLAQDDKFNESLTRPATEPVTATTEIEVRRS